MEQRVEEIRNRILNLKSKYEKDSGSLETYKKEKSEKEKEINKLKKDFEHMNIKKELLEKASEEARKNGKEVLCTMATSSVQSVLGDNLEVLAEFKKRSGISVADVLIKSKYGEEERITDPSEEEGGGLADIVSLSLFMSVRLLVGASNTAPNFLDEPTKYLSKGKWELASEFIRKMVDNTQIQTFIVTHDRDYLPFVADTSYELSLNEKGESVANKIN